MKYQHFILPILAFTLFASLTLAGLSTDEMTVAEHLDAAGKFQAKAKKWAAEGYHINAADYYSWAATSFEAGGEHEKAVAMGQLVAKQYEAYAVILVAKASYTNAADYYNEAAKAYEAIGEHEKAREMGQLVAKQHEVAQNCVGNGAECN